VPDHGSPVTGGEGSRALDSRKRYLHDSVKDCSNRCTNSGASKLPLLRESSFSLVITVTTPSLTSVVEVTQAAQRRGARTHRRRAEGAQKRTVVRSHRLHKYVQRISEFVGPTGPSRRLSRRFPEYLTSIDVWRGSCTLALRRRLS